MTTLTASRAASEGNARARPRSLSNLLLFVAGLVFALVVIGVLGIGVGANAAVFSVFKGVVLRPLPGVDDANGLGVVITRTTGGRIMPLTHPDFEYIRDHDQAFSSLAASSNQRLSVADDRRTERVWSEIVSGRYFEMLGVTAQLGRVLDAGDDIAPGGHPVSVISDGLWRRDFESDPAIVGRTVEINNQTLTIVGVADPSFHGTTVVYDVEAFVPVMMAPLLGFTYGSQHTDASGVLADPTGAIFTVVAA